MANTSFGKLNLAALPSHKIAKFNQKGKKESIECIVIPIEKNNLFKSEKGNVYLDLVIFENKNPFKDEDGAVISTHMVKQSLPKEVRAALTDEEKKQQPIIGNLNMFTAGAVVEKEATSDDSIESPDNGDDLPF